MKRQLRPKREAPVLNPRPQNAARPRGMDTGREWTEGRVQQPPYSNLLEMRVEGRG